MFLYHLFVPVCVVLLYFLFRKVGVPYPLSRIMLVVMIFSVLVTACLGQNYSHSLIPGIHDGISVSNKIAFFIMGDDGWSHEKFKKFFDGSIIASLLSIVLYLVSLLYETLAYKKLSKRSI